MKKILLCTFTFLLVTITYINAFAQFNENIGTGTSGSISSYTGWQNNSAFTYSGSGDVRTTGISSGYTGASGNSNVYLTATATTSFQIGTINTSSLTNPAITFGLSKSTTSSDATDLKFEYSTNGIAFTQISIPAQPTGSGTTAWRIVLLTGLPSSTTLTVKFTNTTTLSTAYRLDDISINSLSVLPISLTSFTAKPIDETILLNWKTASEKNNQQFEVLKSADGKNFKPIATVNGAGNSDSENSYSFVDENPYAGANYYQLKQTDFNGATTISTVISANAKIEGIKLSAYSSTGSVTVGINSPNQTGGEIALFDMNGRKLDAKSLALNKGYNEVSFNKFLAPGTYFVNLISAGKSTSFKFIK